MSYRDRYGSRYDNFYGAYVSVAEKKARAEKERKKLEAKGGKLSPVVPAGRNIAGTFWGKGWCENLERYSDYSNRLPRGRSYLRNGSVVDLKIEKGKVSALVSGSSLYKIEVSIKPLDEKTWKNIKKECAGKIASLIELIQGKLSSNVMEIITRKDGGLFPHPTEIKLDCSCPDSAYLCKHLAAVLYGIGTRLDFSPELFFILRGLDHKELIGEAAAISAITEGAVDAETLAVEDLEDVFGVKIDVPRKKTEKSAAVKTKPVI
ncbi:MAG: SWIM zinc finger family protein, partial [Victivallales bacterium]